MTRYRIDLSPRAVKDLRRIRDKRIHDRMIDAIATLAGNPRPDGVTKLAGKADKWRIRVGEWRVVYHIDDGRLVVLVVTLGVRGGVYRVGG